MLLFMIPCLALLEKQLPPFFTYFKLFRISAVFLSSSYQICTLVRTRILVLAHLYFAQSGQLVEFSWYDWRVLRHWRFWLLGQVQVWIVARAGHWAYPLLRMVLKSWMETVFQAAVKWLRVVCGWLRRLLQWSEEHIVGLHIISARCYSFSMFGIFGKITIETVSVWRRCYEISLAQI